MRTIRITLVGGPYCGESFTDCPSGAPYLYISGVKYIRSDRRDVENRQVFLATHNRTIAGLRRCDLG